jgi:chromate reductase
MSRKVLAFAGSTKAASVNRKLLAVAVEATRAAGLEVTEVDLNDYEMPLFSEELEAAGVPENFTRLKAVAI